MIVILNGANSSKTVATLRSFDTAIYTKATQKEEESFSERSVVVVGLVCQQQEWLKI